MNEFDSIKKLVRADGFLYTKDVVEAGIRKEKLKYFLDEGDLKREGYMQSLTIWGMNLPCYRRDAGKVYSLTGQRFIFTVCRIGPLM